MARPFARTQKESAICCVLSFCPGNWDRRKNDDNDDEDDSGRA